MKLNEKDFKLLTYLYHHSREPSTKIAKQCKLTREQVNYRLDKYLSEGLIRTICPVFNYSKLGYNYILVLFLKLDKPSSYKAFSEKLASSKNCHSWGKVFGKYDIFANMIFKDEQDFDNYISKLLSESKHPVSDYYILKPYFSELYPLKFFKSNEKDTLLFVGETSEKIKLDNVDKEILKELAKDARSRLIDIATKANISSELALHRLRKLQKQKVILGSRIQFDMEKFGYHFSLILLNIRHFTEEIKNKIKQFARNSKYINTLNFSLTKPNCIIQLFHKEESELRQTIQKIKELFADDIIDLELMLITDETEKVNALPFL